MAVPAADTLIPTVGVASPVGAADIGGGNAIGELERGRVYYAQVCMPCHGARGDGQGEWAYRVTPRPADLTGQRTQGRSDRELYRIIGDGLPATAMTGWKRRLSDRQLWQLVAYLRHLGGSGA